MRWLFWFVFFNSLFPWNVSHEPACVHWRQPSANGNNLHEMVIVASIQSSGSHPGQWDQLFFWEAVHVGLLILQMNYRKKERKRKKEASLMDRYWWKNLFCPGIIRRLFVRRGCVFIVTDAHPGGWDRGICIVLLCEIASVIFYTNSWSVWGVKHGEGLNFVVLVLSDRFFFSKTGVAVSVNPVCSW